MSVIADGMEYTERKGIVRRDIATRIILSQSRDQVKIRETKEQKCFNILFL